MTKVLSSPDPDRWRPKYRPSEVFSPAYSRFVGLMRYLLPAAALILVGVIVAWPGHYGSRDGFRLSFADISNGVDGPTMANARYIGTDSNDRPFVITADSAVQDPEDKRRIILRAIQADITLSDGTWVTLSANRGNYDQDGRILYLSGAVDMFSDRGYEFHTERVRVDLASGTATGDQQVQGQGPFGLLQAYGFKLTGMGQVILFPREVKLTIFMKGHE